MGVRIYGTSAITDRRASQTHTAAKLKKRNSSNRQNNKSYCVSIKMVSALLVWDRRNALFIPVLRQELKKRFGVLVCIHDGLSGPISYYLYIPGIRYCDGTVRRRSRP